MYDPIKIREDFPILTTQVHGQPLVYLDNAATSQKPRQVIEAISNYYQTINSNVHRGVHQLSEDSTDELALSRQKIADFFGAEDGELILVRNTTEALNGIASGWADHQLEPGDVILTSLMEHHSNFVVWQQVCQRTGAKLEVVGLDQEGRLDLNDFKNKLEKNSVKLVALVHVSNTTGVINPVEKIKKLIDKKDKNIRFLIDGAQSAPHLPVNFHDLGADFFTFSGHKMLAPMGVGGLLVKQSLLKSGEMQPWLYGGGMIDVVTPEKTTFNPEIIDRFVAGTPDVASAIGLAAATDYLTNLGMENVEKHDRELVNYALKKLGQMKEIKVIGPNDDRLGSVAFIHQSVHAHDVAQVLDSQGVAVRSGHHCTMPLHLHFDWLATTRASFNVYNTQADVDELISALQKVNQVFS